MDERHIKTTFFYKRHITCLNYLKTLFSHANIMLGMSFFHGLTDAMQHLPNCSVKYSFIVHYRFFQWRILPILVI